MKKYFLLTIVFCVAILFSFSQNSGLLVKMGAKGLYVEHTVAAKENFYSIGRVYNINPKHFAAFNGLDMSKGLSVGQVVDIPLSDTNFNQHSAVGTPLYYKASSKQTVGAISAISKTAANNIRKWNKLAADTVSANSPVIIGYFISSGEVPDVEVVNKQDDIKDTKSLPEEKKDSVKEKPAKQVEAKTQDIVKTEPVKEEPVKKTEAKKTVSTDDSYFKTYFALQTKTYPLTKDETITSGIFKTTSGLTDGKYYALLDGVEPGTIIKVVNPVNSKVVYAKVLGKMNGIHQNEGLSLRISNAAASALEISETDKFIVKVNY